MNHRVPDFEMDDEYQISTRPRKSARGEEDEIMELRWQNGEVVVQSQNQRSLRKSHATEALDQPLSREIRSEEEMTPHLFMQEDEMVSWLHYPLDETPFERDLYSDLLYPTPSVPPEVRPLPPRPPVPPARRVELESESPSQRYQNQNFLNLRMKGGIESGPSNTMKPARESTVVDSNEHGNVNSSGACVAATCELTVTSSPGGSGGSVSASGEPSQKPPSVTEDRKRKGREGEDSECHSEGVEFESAAAKKQAHGSTSTRRSRAAEVHNLSERRRRDRINEKMKALQELIPGCNKSDKASMLDEAIEYLKSLQMQVQMMSMGCSMVPVMFPGVQQFMPPMAMGMGMGLNMGMGMGMDMGMSRPMVPFPPVLPSSALQNPAAAAAHLGPRFSMPAFHMPPVPGPDPSRIQATNQSDPMLSSHVSQNPNQARAPNFADPYQQYLGLHHTQVPLPQNHAVGQPNTSRPSSSREVGNPENQ